MLHVGRKYRFTPQFNLAARSIYEKPLCRFIKLNSDQMSLKGCQISQIDVFSHFSLTVALVNKGFINNYISQNHLPLYRRNHNPPALLFERKRDVRLGSHAAFLAAKYAAFVKGLNATRTAAGPPDGAPTSNGSSNRNPSLMKYLGGQYPGKLLTAASLCPCPTLLPPCPT